jgi:hypothetical protein
MKITNHFTDGTMRTTTAGVRVPYTAETAMAYRTIAAAKTANRQQEQKNP